jgi:hypothetical protein
MAETRRREWHPGQGLTGQEGETATRLLGG